MGNCWIWPAPQPDWIWIWRVRNWKAITDPPPWAFRLFQSFTPKWRSLVKKRIQYFSITTFKLKRCCLEVKEILASYLSQGETSSSLKSPVLPSKPLLTTLHLISTERSVLGAGFVPWTGRLIVLHHGSGAHFYLTNSHCYRHPNGSNGGKRQASVAESGRHSEEIEEFSPWYSQSLPL